MTLLAWATGCAATGDPNARYNGQIVVAVAVDGPVDAARLAAIGDVWTEAPVDEVLLRIDADDTAALDALGRTYTTVVPDLGEALRLSAPPAVPGSDRYADYLPLDAVDDALDELASRSTRATVHVLGTSVEGRPIRGLKIAPDEDDDRVPTDRLGFLVVGGQHAREWVGVMSALWIAEQLVDGDGVDPAVTALLDERRVVVVPVMNPDGYRHTWTTDRMWRKNRRDNGDGSYGVDLNRNWGVGWGGAGAPDLPNSDNYPGPAPFSEPETAAVRDYLADHPMLGFHLDLHNFSQAVLHPFGFTPVVAPDADALGAAAADAAAAMTELVGTSYRSGSMIEALYPASGVAVDWSYAAEGAFSYLIELPDRGRYGFLQPPEQIVPIAEEAWAGFLALATRPERPHGRLSVGALGGDGAGVATVDRALAGAEVELYGTATGAGSTVLGDGTVLALDNAVLLGSATALPRGRAEIGFVAPGSPGDLVRLQAREGVVVSTVTEVVRP